MGIKDSRVLWNQLIDWIIELGMENYNLSKSKILTGDLENVLVINSSILITNITI